MGEVTSIHRELPIRTQFRKIIAPTTLDRLTDDDLIDIAVEVGKRFRTTFVTASQILPILLEVKGWVEAEVSGLRPDGDLVIPAPQGRAKSGSPTPGPETPNCCEGEVYAGPSGSRRRHICKGLRGQPWVGKHAISREFLEAAPRLRGYIETKTSKFRKGTVLHPACLAAWDEGLSESCCPYCLYRLCPDDDCQHPVCKSERGWLGYFEDGGPGK